MPGPLGLDRAPGVRPRAKKRVGLHYFDGHLQAVNNPLYGEETDQQRIIVPTASPAHRHGHRAQRKPLRHMADRNNSLADTMVRPSRECRGATRADPVSPRWTPRQVNRYGCASPMPSHRQIQALRFR